MNGELEWSMNEKNVRNTEHSLIDINVLSAVVLCASFIFMSMYD